MTITIVDTDAADILTDIDGKKMHLSVLFSFSKILYPHKSDTLFTIVNSVSLFLLALNLTSYQRSGGICA